MIFLGDLTEITPTKSRVGMIHNSPFDSVNGMGMTQTQLEAIGILVDSIPDPQPPISQTVSGMFIDPITKAISYEYVDRPLTPEEELTNLKVQLQATQDAVDFLLMGGM